MRLYVLFIESPSQYGNGGRTAKETECTTLTVSYANVRVLIEKE